MTVDNWINLGMLLVGVIGGVVGGFVASQNRLGRLESHASSAEKRLDELDKMESRVVKLESSIESMNEKMADFKVSLKDALTELRELRDIIR